MNRCIVIGASPELTGDLIRTYVSPADTVFCADGGAALALSLGLTVDLIVGDFDSWTPPGVLPAGTQLIRLNTEKDETDMQYALSEGVKRGHTSFVLLGGVGGRLDHTLANIASLEWLLSRGCEGLLAGAQCEVRLGRAQTLRFDGQVGHTLSIFPHGCPACVVSGDGVQYPLHALTLTSDMPLGVSNRILDVRCHVTVEEGTAVFLLQK